MTDIQTFLVRKSGTNYEASRTGSYVLQKINSQWEAQIKFDNANDWITSVFAEEDEVEIYVDSVSAANKLMVGYIDDIGDGREPSRNKEQVLSIIGWGDYLAGKTIFERDYWKTKTASQVLANAAAEISGLSTSITGLATSPDHDMKRNFQGTYVKDAYHTVSENAGCDFFTDETKTLRAFAHGALNLTESGTGNIYKIRDIAPSAADYLMVHHNFPYRFHRNVSNRFRTVVASNGIHETYPVDVDQFQIATLKHDTYGKTFSKYYQVGFSEYDIDTTAILPAQFQANTDVGGGLVMPTVRLPVASASQTYLVGIHSQEFASDYSTLITQDFGIVAADWQKLIFFMKNALSGAVLTSIKLQLHHDGTNYWHRDITADLNSTNFTMLAYDLPDGNGWTKVLNPTKINYASIIVTPATGWTAETYLEFGRWYFLRRQRATVTGAGSPATEKIIVDASAKSKTSLTTLATKEQARSNVVANHGYFTIAGNQAFKKPGYNISVDFTTTLGSGRSGTVRIESIKHFLQDSFYYTEVQYNNAYQRA